MYTCMYVCIQNQNGLFTEFSLAPAQYKFYLKCINIQLKNSKQVKPELLAQTLIVPYM